MFCDTYLLLHATAEMLNIVAVLVGSWQADYQADQYARTCVSFSCQVLHARSRVA